MGSLDLSVLVVDDDKAVRKILSSVVSSTCVAVDEAGTLQEALEKARNENYDLVFLDVKLPDGNGIEAITHFSSQPSEPEVVIMTGYAQSGGVEEAIHRGAWDYLIKPFSLKLVRAILTRTSEYRHTRSHEGTDESFNFPGIVGPSAAMHSCYKQLGLAGRGDVNVLLTGESGAGKELCALAIHENSRRRTMPFIVVDCTALPPDLVEGVLFGHEKGAFTSADRERLGLMKMADGGTLFLDEVAELPMSVQTAFLRAIQERRFRPIGGQKEVKSEFRLIAATNRNLGLQVAEQDFRQDLFFRLNVLPIHVPPLRERRDDIPSLVKGLMASCCERYSISVKQVDPEALEVLVNYHWPGNIRQLSNAVQHAATTAGNDLIVFAKHLPNEIRVASLKARYTLDGSLLDGAEMSDDAETALKPWTAFKKDATERAEREYVTKLQAATGGDVGEALKISDMSRSSYYALVKKVSQSK
ncbi:sigma-54-dependent transcriptional regulator [Candidatus Hydrogenedentota bacterium]